MILYNVGIDTLRYRSSEEAIVRLLAELKYYTLGKSHDNKDPKNYYQIKVSESTHFCRQRRSDIVNLDR